MSRKKIRCQNCNHKFKEGEKRYKLLLEREKSPNIFTHMGVQTYLCKKCSDNAAKTIGGYSTYDGEEA